MASPEPIPRLAARVVLLDEHDRILLFQADFLGRRGRHTFWFTPGGGLEAGETHDACAARELWEETGLREVAIGPCIWTRRHVFRIPLDGGEAHYDQQERYFLARVSNARLRFDNWETHERELMTGHRWWRLEEIRSSEERFVPGALALLLEPILAGRIPEVPVEAGA